MKAFCEDCQSPQTVNETGEPIPGKLATYKRFDLHKDPKEPKVCTGSGKKV